MKNLRVTLAVLLSFGLVFTGVIALWARNCQSFLDETRVSGEYIIEKGLSYPQIYQILFEGQSLPHGFDMYLKKIRHIDKQLHYGYYLADNTPLSQLLNNVTQGKQTLIKVTFPEGYNMYDIAQALENVGIAKKSRVLTVFNDRKLVKKLTGAEHASMEGFLAPGTYYFQKNHGPEKIATKLVTDFFASLPVNFGDKVKQQGIDFYEAITLASVVQKETYSATESPIVAAVYLNRYRIHMLLQADPTIIYGLIRRGTYDGNLHTRDLRDSSNNYNTYKHKGLMPTPICTPSKMALEAIVNPARVNYYYFVAQQDGTHVFSETYEEHKQNVRIHQQGGKP